MWTNTTKSFECGLWTHETNKVLWARWVNTWNKQSPLSAVGEHMKQTKAFECGGWTIETNQGLWMRWVNNWNNQSPLSWCWTWLYGSGACEINSHLRYSQTLLSIPPDYIYPPIPLSFNIGFQRSGISLRKKQPHLRESSGSFQSSMLSFGGGGGFSKGYCFPKWLFISQAPE